MNEELIIDKAKQGDKTALSELVKKYERTVFNFAFKVCRDRDKAENTMQDAFLSMVKSLNQFDGKSKLSTWLYRIVSNHCLMEHRKRKLDYVDLESDDEDLLNEKYFADSSMLPNQGIENDELKQALDNAIKKLSPEYRLVFLLRDVEEQSTEETAKILDLSVPAVKSRLHRARAFLRNEITEALKK
jgi:RNA polymerase sigma-70 factor (ECF subfamily)